MAVTLKAMQLLYGLHPVEEAILSGNRRLDYVLVARQRHDLRLQHAIDLCRKAAIQIRFEPREQLTRLARTENHQGIVAVVAERIYSELEELLVAGREPLFLLALDGVEDPHNLGALLRSADGAGADGVLIPERRAVSVNATVAKASAGAADHVRIARVTNLARALEALKRSNVWCVGLDERGTQTYDSFDYRTNFVLVLGGEGSGLRDLVRRTCDHLLRIPMEGKVPSLNVSVAGAVVMYEAARQRRVDPKEMERSANSAPTRDKRISKGLGS